MMYAIAITCNIYAFHAVVMYMGVVSSDMRLVLNRGTGRILFEAPIM